MTFHKGDPKPSKSGRKKGAKNKKTLLKVEEFLASRNVHPVEEILKRLPLMEPEAAARILLELMKYWQPQIKPAEAPAQPDQPPATANPANVAHLMALASGKP